MNHSPHTQPSPIIRVYPPTAVEIGIWAIFSLGAFLGAAKRYLPAFDSLVSLAYDLICFGTLVNILWQRLRRSWHIPYNPIFLPLIAFVSFSFLTILNPALPSLIQGVMGWRFLSSSLLLFFAGFYAFSDRRRIWRVLTLFSWVGILVALYGLVQLIRGYTPTEQAWINNLSATMIIENAGGRYRLMSTTGSGVDLGFLLCLNILALVGQTLATRQGRTWRVGALGLMSVVLIYTYVRTAWMALLLGLTFLLLARFWYIKGIRLAFPLILGMGITLMLLLPFGLASVANQFDNLALRSRLGSLSNPFADRSINDRLHTWDTIWDVIQEHPLGLGTGTTGAASLRYASTIPSELTVIDNTYLKIVVEMGWLGLAIFLWLVFTVLWQSWRAIAQLSGADRILGLGLAACFVAFLLLLVFGEYIELNPGRSLIWILMGFLCSLPRLTREAAAQVGMR